MLDRPKLFLASKISYATKLVTYCIPIERAKPIFSINVLDFVKIWGRKRKNQCLKVEVGNFHRSRNGGDENVSDTVCLHSGTSDRLRPYKEI